MISYIESYEILGKIYGISCDRNADENEDCTYTLWVGGCAVRSFPVPCDAGQLPAMNQMRIVAHVHATDCLKNRRADLLDEVKLLNENIAKLGTDPFNLGRFLK